MRRFRAPGAGSWRSPVTRRVAAACLAVDLVGVAVFGSVMAAVGEWTDGRRLETVAGWAAPGLVLAVLATFASVRTLLVGEGRWSTLASTLAVAASLASLVVLNPSTAPPVP